MQRPQAHLLRRACNLLVAYSRKSPKALGTTGLATVVLMLVVVYRAPAPPEELSPVRTNVITRTSFSPPAPARFEDVTLQARLTFSHLQGDADLSGLNESLGAGACVLDFDGDGWMDIFLVNGTGQTRYYGKQHWWHLPAGHALYRNRGHARFEDVSAQAGLRGTNWGMGCAAGDLDNDGDPDLIVTSYGPNQVLRNNGDGTFTDVTAASGLNGHAWSTSAVLGDYDGDGLLDVYVVNFLVFEKLRHTYEAANQFSRDTPVRFDPRLYTGAPNRLYRNTGNLVFTDVTDTAGVADNTGRGLAALWLDADGDDRLDLLVANAAGTPNRLYVNQGDGHFTDQAASYHLASAMGARGLAAGDIDNDGMTDVLAGTGNGEQPALFLFDPQGKRFREDMRNRLTTTAGELSTWGVAVADFNNDGWLDLFTANGMVKYDPDAHRVPRGQPNTLLLNQQGLFVPSTKDAGNWELDSQSSRAAVLADFDNDGWLDVFVANNNDMGQLLRGIPGEHHWMNVALRDDGRPVVGARVEVTTKTGMQTRHADGGQAFLGTHDPRLHFGLGGADAVSSVRVTWPDGTESRYRDLPVDAHVVLDKRGEWRRVELPPAPARASGPGLRVGERRPLNRIEYLHWLVAARGAEAFLDALEEALSDNDPRVRSAVLSLLAVHRHPEGLRLIIRALEDAEMDVRLAALDAARIYEEEATVRWLLRSLDDPQPAVREATAEVFRYFFQEEEAVIYRKYLAIPRLIGCLEDDQPKVRAAAARALGEAERYRALHPLIHALADADPRVRADAAWALGRMREREAIEPLRVHLEREQDATARAQVLIALVRLGHDRVLSWLEDRVQQSPLAVYETLEALFGLDDRVVLSVDEVLRRVIAAKPASIASPHSHQLAFVRMLAASGTPTAVPWLRALSGSPGRDIRGAAFRALFRLDTAQAARHLERALKDPAEEVRALAAKELARGDIAMTTDAYLRLLRGPALSQDILAAAPSHADTRVTRALVRLLGRSRDLGLSAAVVEALAAMPGPVSGAAGDAIAPLRDHEDATIRRAAFAYAYAGYPEHVASAVLPALFGQALADSSKHLRHDALAFLATRHEAWAWTAIEQHLFGPGTALDTRRRLVDALAARGDEPALKALSRLASNRHDPLRTVALARLAESGSPLAEDDLLAILEDDSESDDVRFLAAKGLRARHLQRVLDVIGDIDGAI